MDVMYKDEATNSLWIGVNPRGTWIDFKRVSDGFVIEKVHSVGRHLYGFNGGYQCQYRNKRAKAGYYHTSVFQIIGKPNPAD